MIELIIRGDNAANLRNDLAGILAESAPVAPAPTIALPAQFGAELQGGIYAGPIWEGGKLVHLIAAQESIGDRKWEAAKTKAAEYRSDGFEDWFLPERQHLMIAQIYIKDKFEKAYHWSATPYGENFAWAVTFENGSVYILNRFNEFLVRPFRRLSI